MLPADAVGTQPIPGIGEKGVVGTWLGAQPRRRTGRGGSVAARPLVLLCRESPLNASGSLVSAPNLFDSTDRIAVYLIRVYGGVGGGKLRGFPISRLGILGETEPVTSSLGPGICRWDHIANVQSETERYLQDTPNLQKRLDVHLSAAYEIVDLVPETLKKLGSGHFFPIAESFRELEASFLLAACGFYRHALVGLRSALELALIGIYKDRNDEAEKEISSWLRSSERHLNYKKMFKEMKNVPSFSRWFANTNFYDSVMETYDNLGGFVHVRGFPYSSMSLSEANFNRFNHEVLGHFVDQLCHIARCIVIVILLKYPWGIEPLPVFAKFGLNPPLGGLLDEQAHAKVCAILEPWEVALLKVICSGDAESRGRIEGILAMSDLTSEEIDMQAEEIDRHKTTEPWQDA